MNTITRLWSHLWYGPVEGLRLWWLQKAVLVVLALDCWMLMIERGGRYGAGGFNVAHFSWMDAALPLPTPGLYLAVIFSSGWLAALCATGSLKRLGLLTLTALYTYGWAMSQLDSYQHHYFLSWVLLCLSLFPFDGFESQAEAPRKVSCFGFRLLAAQLVILYVYTGLSKTEPQWLSGSVLQRINQDSGALQPVLELFGSLGMSPEQFWSLAGLGVVAAQGAIALLWLSLLWVGEGASRWVAALRVIGVLVALGFHLGAEVAGLRIGWFGGYMIALTLLAFAPASWLRALAHGVVGLKRSLHRWSSYPIAPNAQLTVLWLGLSLLVVSALYICHRELELPGIEWVGAAVAAWLGLRCLQAVFRRSIRTLRVDLVACVVWLAILQLGLSATTVRYDFYRFLGGDLWRRQQVQASLTAYGKANSFAPEGEGRHKKVREILSRLPID